MITVNKYGVDGYLSAFIIDLDDMLLLMWNKFPVDLRQLLKVKSDNGDVIIMSKNYPALAVEPTVANRLFIYTPGRRDSMDYKTSCVTNKTHIKRVRDNIGILDGIDPYRGSKVKLLNDCSNLHVRSHDGTFDVYLFRRGDYLNILVYSFPPLGEFQTSSMSLITGTRHMVTGASKMLIPNSDKPLFIEECCRKESLPDAHTFYGKLGDLFMEACNSYEGGI